MLLIMNIRFHLVWYNSSKFHYETDPDDDAAAVELKPLELNNGLAQNEKQR